MVNPNTIIKLVDINYSVINDKERLDILKAVNLTINVGTSVAITGSSGSGKTCLLTIMAGLEQPSTGCVYHGNQNITLLNEDQRAKLRARQIGFVFQSFQLLPNLTALENVMLPLEINRLNDCKNTALLWLNRVGLTNRTAHYPLQLSGGEQQRVAIARAFATTPTVLFADEPTGNLDKKTALAIIDLLFELNSRHQSTLVMITHDETLANRCQFHWSLLDGQLIC
jgi:putative ABC transport system ATP-binding protein